MRYCSNCGNQLGDNAQFCQNCGAAIDKAENQHGDINYTKKTNENSCFYKYVFGALSIISIVLTIISFQIREIFFVIMMLICSAMCIWMWYSRTEHGKAFVAGCKAEAKAKEAEKKAKEAEAKAKAVAELASKKKEYMRYAKDIDDIANYPTKFQNENMWLTYSDNEKSPECAVNKICADYQLVKNHREEYFDWTKELMDIMGNFKDANLKPMQNSENEITKIFKQFEKNYKYDDDKPSVLVFRDSLKNIINAMKMRRKTADFMIKKGENFEGLSDAEEFFLIQANNMLQLIDEKIKENKENADIAERKKILQELDNIKCAQQEQQWIATQQGKELQHILKTGKPRGFLDIIFDVHEYKD